MKPIGCTLLLALCCCGRQDDPPYRDQSQPSSLLVHETRPPIRHDFGVIRHGEIAVHEFKVQFPADTVGGPVGYQPRGFQAGCVCGDGSFSILDKEGTRREFNLGRNDAKILKEGERLLFRLSIDTRVKEAVDMPPLTSHGNILLQDARQQRADITLPIVYTFAIDSPVLISPFSQVALGRLSRHSPIRLQFELAGDASHRDIRFLDPKVSDPRLMARLVPVHDASDRTLIEVVFTPRGDEFDGALPRMQVEVPTEGADDYIVILPVTGTILPDVEVEPPQGISFSVIPKGTPADQFANILVHDRRLPVDWSVLQIRSTTGEPLASHFETRLETLEGIERALRLHLRYLGTLDRSFRGVVSLVPTGRLEPVVPVEFRGFHR